MKAYDVMSVDVIAAKDNVTAIEIGTRLVLGAFNGLPIIDDNGMVIGIVTTIDILRAIRDGKNLEKMLARDLMTKNPSVVMQDTKIEDIIDIMDKKGIEMVPVVEEGKEEREDDDNPRLVGIVSRSDILTEKMNERFVTVGRKRIATTTLGQS
jgi:CBS domain-containing protein